MNADEHAALILCMIDGLDATTKYMIMASLLVMCESDDSRTSSAG